MIYGYALLLVITALVYRWLSKTPAVKDPMVPAKTWIMAMRYPVILEARAGMRKWRREQRR